MTKYTERLMSRTSVAAMAVFAPKDAAASVLPAYAERIDTDAGGGGDDAGPGPIDGLSADEQAQVDAMMRGEGGTPPGDAPADGNDGIVDDGEDGDGDGEPPAAADAPAPREGDTPAAREPAEGERPAPKTVSYGKYQRELLKIEGERQKLQTALETARGETVKEREERLRLDERTKLLLDAISRKAPVSAADAAPADPEPDGEADPIAHLQWSNRQLRRTVDDLQSGQTRQRELTAAETEERGVYAALESDINRTAASDPTFISAFDHLRESRFQELGFIYSGIDINDKAAVDAALTPAQQSKLAENIQRSFYNEQILVARQSLAAEKSPAAVIRNLARARGWVAKAPEVPADGGEAPPAPRGGAPAARAPAARAPAAAPSVREQLNAVRDNLDASRSLSDAGGSPGGQMTPQRIAEMTPEEFERYYDSVPKDQFDKMMGKVPL